MRHGLRLMLLYLCVQNGGAGNISPKDEQRGMHLDYSKLCPYTRQCFSEAAKVFRYESDRDPCCFRCSCHKDCSAMENCCPDYKQENTSSIHFSCLPRKVKARKYDRSGYNGHSHYYVVNRCDKTNTDRKLSKRCLRNTKLTLESFIWVSDRESGRIFQNRFCAECNYVTEVIPWQISTTCDEVWLADFTTLNDTILSDRCDIINSAPSSVALAAREYQCSTPLYSKCNQTGLWGSYDLGIEEGCRGLRATYFFPAPSGALIPYKNVFCFKCNEGEQTNVPEICPKLQDMNKAGINVPRFSALLNFRRHQKSKYTNRLSKCGRAEIIDEHYNRCRPLLCPFMSAPYFGTCEKLAKLTGVLILSVHFKLSIVSHTGELDVLDDHKLALEVLQYFRRNLDFEEAKCVVCSEQFRTDAGRNTVFYALTTFEMTPACQYDTVAKMISATLQTTIQISFLESGNYTLSVSLEKRSVDDLMLTSREIHSFGDMGCMYLSIQLRNDIFCPTVELNHDDITSVPGLSKISGLIKSLHMDLKTNTSHRICVYDYFSSMQEHASGAQHQDHAFWMIALTTFMFILWWEVPAKTKISLYF